MDCELQSWRVMAAKLRNGGYTLRLLILLVLYEEEVTLGTTLPSTGESEIAVLEYGIGAGKTVPDLSRYSRRIR